jgi:hypothetical protein
VRDLNHISERATSQADLLGGRRSAKLGVYSIRPLGAFDLNRYHRPACSSVGMETGLDTLSTSL